MVKPQLGHDQVVFEYIEAVTRAGFTVLAKEWDLYTNLVLLIFMTAIIIITVSLMTVAIVVSIINTLWHAHLVPTGEEGRI